MRKKITAWLLCGCMAFNGVMPAYAMTLENSTVLLEDYVDEDVKSEEQDLAERLEEANRVMEEVVEEKVASDELKENTEETQESTEGSEADEAQDNLEEISDSIDQEDGVLDFNLTNLLNDIHHMLKEIPEIEPIRYEVKANKGSELFFDELSEKEKKIHQLFEDYFNELAETQELKLELSVGEAEKFEVPYDEDYNQGEVERVVEEKNQEWQSAIQNAFDMLYVEYGDNLWFDTLTVMGEATAAYDKDADVPESITWILSYRIGIPTELSIEEIGSRLSAMKKAEANPDVELKYSTYEWEVVRLFNDERAKKGIKPMFMEARFQEVAHIRINELQSYYDLNFRPDKSPWHTAIRDVDPDCWDNPVGGLGETGATTPEGCVQYIKDNKTDYLAEKFTLIGSANSGTMWFQVFSGVRSIEEIEIVHWPDTEEAIKVGTEFSKNGFALRGLLNDGKYAYVPFSSNMKVEAYESNVAGRQDVVVAYNNVSLVASVTLSDKGKEEFVNRLFENMLGRKPGATEANQRNEQLSSGKETVASMTHKFMESQEAKNKKYTDEQWIRILFKVLQDRSPISDEMNTYKEMLKNGVSIDYICKLMVSSLAFTYYCKENNLPEGTFTPTQNRDQNYDITCFVQRCYQLIHGRSGDVNGLNYWTGILLNKQTGGSNVVLHFLGGKEYAGKNKTNAETVEICYKTMMNRSSDASGKEYWTNILNSGVSYAYLVSRMGTSTEFKGICAKYGIDTGKVEIKEDRDKNIRVTAFVNRCYREALSRKGEPEGLNIWTNRLLNKLFTPESATKRFVFSKESLQKNLNDEEFIKMLYRVCMGRNADTQGLTTWKNRLKSGMTRETAFDRMAASKEFQGIIDSFNIK